MAKGFAIHNAPTDHGGLIPATQFRDSQMGNAFVRAGDGHFCPKCKCWSTVIKSHDHVIIDGKPVAYVGDKLTCGARIQPQQSHVVGDSGSYYGSSSPIFQPINSQQNLTNSLVDNKNSDSDKAYYKWWWGKLESTNPKTIAQEKNSFLQNFSDLHDEYAFGKVYKVYEIDPKAWDGEVAFDGVFPNGIQQSVDSSGDLGKALAKLADGQSSNITWKNIGVGGDYFKTIRSKQWPHGRWACTVTGTLTRFGKDANGRYDFQFKGYAKIEKDYYSWEEDNNGVKNKGIKLLGDAIEMAAGTKKASPIYSNPKQYGLPTICMRKYHFDYYKKGIKKPNY